MKKINKKTISTLPALVVVTGIVAIVMIIAKFQMDSIVAMEINDESSSAAVITATNPTSNSSNSSHANDVARGAKVFLDSPEVIKLFNSIVWPVGSTQSSATVIDRSLFSSPTIPTRNLTKSDWNIYSETDAKVKGGQVGQRISPILTSSVLCKSPIDARFAVLFKEKLTALGVDASTIINDSRRYVDWADAQWSYSGLQGFITMNLDWEKQTDGIQRWVYVKPVPIFGYCLDKDYVSNYSAYVNNFAPLIARANAIGLKVAAKTPGNYFKTYGLMSFTNGTVPSTNLLNNLSTSPSTK